jgi:hypothetical protein
MPNKPRQVAHLPYASRQTASLPDGSGLIVRKHQLLDSLPVVGAKLGTIRCGSVWTAVDGRRPGGFAHRAEWLPVDTDGHGLDIYGSEGWGFESLRVCR